jgi:hypothetical protein
MNIKLIKVTSGEDIVCNVIEETEEYLVIKNGITPIPNQNGTIGFIPFCPLEKKDGDGIKISTNFIMYATEPADEIAQQFERMINPSALTTPEKKKLIL